jgi:hypothetical protein
LFTPNATASVEWGIIVRQFIGAGLAALALFAAGAGAAQPANTGKPSVDWTVQALLANPAAKAVLDKDLPGYEDNPSLVLVLTMTLRTVAQLPEAQIDQAKLDQIAAHLAALPGK